MQWRQLRLLDANVTYEGDNIVWSFFQLESEYLKLRNTLRDIDRNPAALDRDALQTRYDILVSRVALVDPERTRKLMETRPIQTETVAQLNAFIAAADEFLGPGAAPIKLAEVRAVLARMTPLAEPVHDMAMWANDTMAAQVGERNAQVREQNRISIALTVFQSLLAIGLAVIVVRQLRALEQRGGALERLAARLQEARRDAEAASHTKSAFLANMSHELRTPFQGVLGMIALAEDGPLNDQQAEQLRTARESARHLLSLAERCAGFVDSRKRPAQAGARTDRAAHADRRRGSADGRPGPHQGDRAAHARVMPTCPPMCWPTRCG